MTQDDTTTAATARPTETAQPTAAGGTPSEVGPDQPALTEQTRQRLLGLGRTLGSSGLPTPAVGQAWRATWRGESTLGVLVDVDHDDRWADLAPLTPDVEYADPYSAVIGADDSPLGVCGVVWGGLTTPVNLFVLDRYLGDLGERAVTTVIALWKANLAGAVPPDVEVDTGAPDLDAADPRRDYRNELSARLQCLHAAELVDPDEVFVPSELPRRLREAHIGPSALVSPTVTLPAARQIAEGRAQVTQEIAEQIAALLDEDDPSSLVCEAPPIPPALARELNGPSRFALVRDIMRAENIDESDAVRRIPAMVRWRELDVEAADDDAFWGHALDVLQQRG